MASRRTKLSALATAAVLGAGGWFLYSVMAVQGQGTLAQAPLNVQIQIPPAFIMGVDNSGSMFTDELLFRTNQGNGFWNTATRSFFNGVGVANESGATYRSAVNHGGAEVPRPDMFGAARSPMFNRAYFNPAITYTPWLTATGVPEPDSPPAAARKDPRAGGNLTDFTAQEAYLYNYPAGSRLSAGTEYFANLACNQQGNPAVEWRVLAADLVFAGACNTQVRYYRAVVYLPDSEPMPPGYDPSKRILVVGAGPAGTDLWRYDYVEPNFLTDGAAAVQNFANWWTYYGNRNRAMIAAMTASMSDITTIRVGYFQINPPFPGTNVVMRDMADPTAKAALYTQMRNLNASGNTPSRRAVRYMGDQFRRTDAGAPVQLACQKNGGMLFTDGYTNDVALTGGQAVGNADGGMGVPFADVHSNTIADVAAWMYNTNIRPDLPAGRVPVPTACSSPMPDPRLDCQTNLHVNFYGVTLGARGAVYDVDMAATADPYANPPAWAATGTMNLQPANVDDIWHGSLNSRGEYINAQSPTDITEAIRRVLATVSSGSSPSGTIALTGARIGTGSFTVVPFYEARNEGTDWYSTLTARTVSVAPITGVVSFPLAWEVNDWWPAPAARNVLVGRGNATPVPFTPANVDFDDLCDNPRPGMSLCTGAQVAAVRGGVTINQVLAYIRGDQSLEVDRAPPAAAKFRFRTKPLGDIVNSTPVVSGPTDDYGYRGLPAPYGASYATYLTTTKATRRPMVYAGANAGMLHGFDGTSTPGIGGVEAFGFIPQSVLGHTGNLVFPYDAADANDQKFKHRYYVDGPIAVSDAYYGGGWKTVLVGSTGAGARGAFALNVSGASAGGTLAPSDKLWEISDINAALPAAVRNNIGHVLGRPIIVPVKTGNAFGPVRWRAIFGNGYNSVNGNAVLFMVDIGTGAPQITMIQATEASAPAGSNGLGNIVVTDRWGPASDDSLTARASDGFADTVYAADQKGAIWKFDLRTASPADQTVPVFTTHLYTTGPEAGTRQPILGGLTATAGPAGSVMLYFGTGSFSFTSDPIDDTLQSVYGVADHSLGSPVTTLTRASLLEQAVVTTVGTVRSTTSNLMTIGRKGWYMDLPIGERFVGYPRVESGTVFMPTYSPNNAIECSTSGVNWLYGLNALTGGAGLSTVRFNSPTGTSPGSGTGAVALDTTGTAPVKDVAVLAGPRIAPLGPGATPADLAAALAAQCSMVIQVSGAPPLYMPRACGRQSWRQIR